MKGILCVVMSLALLGGCAAMNGFSKSDNARRSAYLAAHPDSPYKQAIMGQGIVVGMSKADVRAAWGFICEPEMQSSSGDQWRCQTPIEAGADDVGLLVQFDNNGRVVSWVH